MTYKKPELAVLGSALTRIRTANKPMPNVYDIDNKHTMNAYEADE